MCWCLKQIICFEGSCFCSFFDRFVNFILTAEHFSSSKSSMVHYHFLTVFTLKMEIQFQQVQNPYYVLTSVLVCVCVFVYLSVMWQAIPKWCSGGECKCSQSMSGKRTILTLYTEKLQLPGEPREEHRNPCKLTHCPVNILVWNWSGMAHSLSLIWADPCAVWNQ